MVIRTTINTNDNPVNQNKQRREIIKKMISTGEYKENIRKMYNSSEFGRVLSCEVMHEVIPPYMSDLILMNVTEEEFVLWFEKHGHKSIVHLLNKFKLK